MSARPAISPALLCRNGSTAIVQCQQPTTDICSFFTRAFVLCGGEVVYFGETGAQAVQLLGAAGMPCPPLYSPLEQFMRLIDPTFEVCTFEAPSSRCLPSGVATLIKSCVQSLLSYPEVVAEACAGRISP